MWEVLSIKRIISLISVVSIALIVLISSGCCGVMNVQNTNKAIDSWNAWTDTQKSYDSEASRTLTLMGEHFSVYQSEVVKSSPNYDLLKRNYETDQNNIQNWNSYLSNLNTATTDFSTQSASLTGDSKQYADDTLRNMRTYHTEMQKAQSDYLAYCGNMISYIDSAQRGYPDSALLQAANNKKDSANSALQNAVAAANQANDSMKRL